MTRFPPPESQSPQSPRPSQRSQKLTLSQRISTLIRFHTQRPWMLWGLAWIVMVFIASIALALLANPFFSTIPQPQRQEGMIPSVVVAETEEVNSPLWSLGAIAFLCIIGTMALRQRPPRR